MRTLALLLVLGCAGAAEDEPLPTEPTDTQQTEQPQTGTWCCWDDDAHTVQTCGLPEGGRPLPAFCWDDATPAHPGDY